MVRVHASFTSAEGHTASNDSAGTTVAEDPNETTSLAVSTNAAVENEAVTASTTPSSSDVNEALSGTTTFQWQASADAGATWNDITGQTGQSFAPDESYQGEMVRVHASFTSAEGHTASNDSAGTTVAEDPNEARSWGVDTNAAGENEAVTASTTPSSSDANEDLNGTTTYQWQVSTDAGATWNDITGQTGQSFTPDESYQGEMVRVHASFTSAEGHTASNDSAGTVVAEDPNETTSLAVSTNAAVENEAVTASTTPSSSDANEDLNGTTTYQWQVSTDAGATWNDITGQTGQSFTPDESYQGEMVRVHASFTSAEGHTASNDSAGTTVAEDPNETTSLEVSTNAAVENEAVTASTTPSSSDVNEDLSGTTTYQWQGGAHGGAPGGDLTRQPRR